MKENYTIENLISIIKLQANQIGELCELQASLMAENEQLKKGVDGDDKLQTAKSAGTGA